MPLSQSWFCFCCKQTNLLPNWFGPKSPVISVISLLWLAILQQHVICALILQSEVGHFSYFSAIKISGKTSVSGTATATAKVDTGLSGQKKRRQNLLPPATWSNMIFCVCVCVYEPWRGSTWWLAVLPDEQKSKLPVNWLQKHHIYSIANFQEIFEHSTWKHNTASAKGSSTLMVIGYLQVGEAKALETHVNLFILLH